MSTGASKLTRRHAIIGAGGVAVTAAGIWASMREGEGASPVAADAPVAAADDTLATVADIVLPETNDGPSASALGVHDFVRLALRHGLEGTLDATAPYAPPGNDYLAWLEAALASAAGGAFASADGQVQLEAVAAIDREAFADRAKPTPWIKLKSLIITGYYTSETGASKVLRYDPVPGKFDGKVRATPDMKTLSNDLTAQKYG